MTRWRAPVEWVFPGVRGSVRAARDSVVAVLAERGIDPEVREQVRLVVSELCTNALVHTRSGVLQGRFTVRLWVGQTRLRVYVDDEGSEHTAPVVQRNPELGEGRRGLALVECFGRVLMWQRLRGCTVGAEVVHDPAHPEEERVLRPWRVCDALGIDAETIRVLEESGRLHPVRDATGAVGYLLSEVQRLRAEGLG